MVESEFTGGLFVVFGFLLFGLSLIIPLLIAINFRGVQDRLTARVGRLPGFRSGSRWKSTVGAFGYLFIISIILTVIGGVLLPADPIEVRDGSLNRSQIKPGEAVTITGTIVNTGNESKSVTVELTIDGNVVNTEKLQLAPEEERELRFTRVFDTPGNHEIQLYDMKIGTVTVASTPTPTPTATASPSPTPSPTPTPSPSPTPSPTPTPSLESKIQSDIQNANFDISAADIDTIRSVSVDRTGDGKRVVLRVRADSYFDSVDAARTGTANAFGVSRLIYNNYNNIRNVTVITLGDFTDQYGNTGEEPVILVVISNESAEKINWEGMEDLIISDYKNFLVVSDKYDIHLAICKNLDELYPYCSAG